MTYADVEPEGGQSTPPEEHTDTIASLKADFTAQLNALREETAKLIKEKDEALATMEKDNSALRAELVRSATAVPTEQPKEKTEEEKYAEYINSRAEVTKRYMTQLR